MDCEPEISWFIPLFYPSSQDTPPDPASTAARLVDDVDGNPVSAATLAIDLPAFIVYFAYTHPTHTDHILQTIKLLLDDPSLPFVDWDSSRPRGTFAEMFGVTFRDYLDANIGGPVKVSERAVYIAGSIVGGRARSLGMLHTPDVVGSLAEGLKLPPSHGALYDYQGEEAEIAVIGSCLQLLGGASYLLQHQQKFTKDKILAALDRVQSDKNDILIQFTKSHIRNDPVVDLTSEEIVDSLKALGWELPRDQVQNVNC